MAEPTPDKPLHFAILLYPGFQLLDVAGPCDILNVLSYTVPLSLSILSRTLDPIPTRPGSAFSQSWVPTHTYASPPKDTIDVLFIPGGLGARGDHSDLVEFILTVCTGSALLAQSGVLDGLRATSNKKSWPWVVTQGPRVEWVYEARWVVSDRGPGRGEGGKKKKEVWTSSGVAAGMDMTLGWIADQWGRDKAKGIADAIEYEWQEDSTVDGFAKLYDHGGAAAAAEQT